MALPVLLSGQVVRMKFYGVDGVVTDYLNSQWFTYVPGGTPAPGGVTIDLAAAHALAAWTTFWTPFQSADYQWVGASINVAAAFTALGGSKYKTVLFSQWSVTGGGNGSVVGAMLPSFCAFSILKQTALPGRGSQGHIRIGGIPEASTADNQLNAGVQAAINAALLANPLILDIGGVGFTDELRPCVINGKLINTTPGNLPPFYTEEIEGLTTRLTVGSQITRKLGRHRS